MVIEAQDTKLRPGYKQTEVGVIPEEWEVKKLGEVADVKTGPFGSTLHEKDYVDDGTPIITVEHLGEQGVVYVNLPMVSDFDRKRLKAYSLLKGDIVFSRVGSVDRNALIKEEESGWLFSGRLLRIRLKASDICSSFLSYYFNQEHTKQRVRSVAVGQTMASLNTQILKNIDIAFPHAKAEQTTIATVLSDTDSLMASLDQLIAKKRDIKQATMQQLLTGKMRLQGFGGVWEVMKLEDVADKNVQWSITGGPFGSNLKTVDYVADGVRIIQLQNIGDGVFHDDYRIYTSEEKANELISCNIYPGEIILSKMGDPVARACIIPNSDRRYLMASDGIRLVINKKRFDTRFVHDYINSIYFRKNAMEASTGSTRQRIGLEDLKKLSFVAPPLSEQQAIATILSDMDAEIAALEGRRDKTHALKQGMMQELLTGKTRLL